jgi:predicted dienelactone hydrolase
MTRRLPGAVAGVVAAVAALGCGHASGTVRSPPATIAPATSPAAGSVGTTCAATPPDLAAPGPYRVGTARATMSRHSLVTGRERRIDPAAWFPVARGDGARVSCRFPLILFSHGAGGRPTDYSLLVSHLASEGFVVIGPHHLDRQEPGDQEAVDRTDDMRFILDRLGAVAARLARRLPAEIDTGHVGVAGHSFGGFTASELAAVDRRIRAVLVMAGSNTAATAAMITAPTLAIAGADDRLIPAARVRAFEQALPPTTPHGLLVIARAGHGAYPDSCTVFHTCAIVDRYATSLFLTYLAGRRAAAAPLDPRLVRDPRLTLRAVAMPPR